VKAPVILPIVTVTGIFVNQSLSTGLSKVSLASACVVFVGGHYKRNETTRAKLHLLFWEWSRVGPSADEGEAATLKILKLLHRRTSRDILHYSVRQLRGPAYNFAYCYLWPHTHGASASRYVFAIASILVQQLSFAPFQNRVEHFANTWFPVTGGKDTSALAQHSAGVTNLPL